MCVFIFLCCQNCVKKNCTKEFANYLKSTILAVWIFHGFSVTQILFEINFGESTSSKNAIVAIYGALNFDNLVNLSLQKVQKSIKKIKVQEFLMC